MEMLVYRAKHFIAKGCHTHPNDQRPRHGGGRFCFEVDGIPRSQQHSVHGSGSLNLARISLEIDLHHPSTRRRRFPARRAFSSVYLSGTARHWIRMRKPDAAEHAVTRRRYSSML